MNATKLLIQSLLEQYGVHHSGTTSLKTPLSLEFYKNWLKESYHGEMAYLEQHVAQKEAPQQLLAGAQSAIVFTYPYTTSEWSHHFPLQHLGIAAYARKNDYHFWLKAKIQGLCKDLKKLFPEEDFIGFTDSAPVMERDLAHRAGLGWFGKNSCLIDRKNGSLFFIAEIYTSLTLETPETLPLDHCGTCRRCIEACPTDAILETRTLDATRCISYWTIESKAVPPEPLREKFGDWFFGCDICQDVCPWNSKIARSLPKHNNANQGTGSLIQELKWILNSSNNQLTKALAHTPLARAGGRGLKRNAMILAANKQIQQVLSDVRAYYEDPVLGELARWSANKISTPPIM
jgi:epoxyqueuosine reductase